MAWVYDQLDGFQSRVEDSFQMIILIVIIDDFLHMVVRFFYSFGCVAIQIMLESAAKRTPEERAMAASTFQARASFTPAKADR